VGVGLKTKICRHRAASKTYVLIISFSVRSAVQKKKKPLLTGCIANSAVKD